MPRQTKEQIDAEIVDRASALFARRGYAHTSLQQVADAVGYSKAGLLHRFASKEAIFRAAVGEAHRLTMALVTATAAVEPGPERDRALVEGVLDTTWERPGTAELLRVVVTEDPMGQPELVEAGIALAGAFGIDSEHFDDDRVTRVLVATSGLQAAVTAAVRLGRVREWREGAVEAAMDALGHRPG